MDEKGISGEKVPDDEELREKRREIKGCERFFRLAYDHFI